MKTTAFLVALLTLTPAFAAVDEDDPEMAIDRAPAIEGLNAEEERLVPYLDSSGTMTGSIRETFQIPLSARPQDLAEDTHVQAAQRTED
ncbi:MAG: hypothetical protein HYR96_04330 [Deltaproteobacteria bacterium]|nr:hypothetical protein [Deltaproteobacteria bacterium]MBI3295407.1 hypothetical protein [Deltaproteobacteria bacterium]